MSETQSDAPKAASEGPVLKETPGASTSAPRQVEPVGDHDNSMLSHLGIPFYYRHSPTRAAARGAFWVTFVVLLAIVVLNVLQMPFSKDTFVYTIRATFFSPYPAYTTAEEGACSICYQLFGISIVLSGIIAPLFATYSFSSERVLGTLEFLRLSPMSTLSVIMGKMFAPGFVMHLVSFTMLLLGLVMGLLGGLAPAKLFLAILCILTTSAIFHALGGLLAVMTVAFRGFFAVGLLLGFGWIISIAPTEMRYERGLSIFTFMSPWGAMDTLFWRGEGRRAIRAGEPLFLGSEALVLPVVLLTHALFFCFLVWAAVRKFDRPERPALPVLAWIGLWAYWMALCLGLLSNFTDSQFLQWNPNYAWQITAALFTFGAFIICTLALLDHPHEREHVLTEECEFAAGREDAIGASGRRLKHAVFISLLTCASTIFMTWMLMNAQNARSYNPLSWEGAITIVGLTMMLAFLFSIVLECAWVRFSSFFVRWGASFVGFAIFLAAIFIPIGAMTSAYYRWDRTIASIVEMHAQQKSGVQRVRRGGMDLNWVRLNPDYAMYLPETDTLEEALRIQDQFRYNMPAFYVHYHPGASIAYPSVFVALAILLLLIRRRIYATLRKEAIAAVKGSPPAATSPPQQQISLPPATA